jgi:hypothetical protein
MGYPPVTHTYLGNIEPSKPITPRRLRSPPSCRTFPQKLAILCVRHRQTTPRRPLSTKPYYVDLHASANSNSHFSICPMNSIMTGLFYRIHIIPRRQHKTDQVKINTLFKRTANIFRTTLIAPISRNGERNLITESDKRTLTYCRPWHTPILLCLTLTRDLKRHR